MKNNFKLFQLFLLMCGVFRAGTDEVKTVMEGDSVTLKPDLTKIQGINQMMWRFRDSRSVIAQIEENEISLSPSLPEMFEDRLKLDQTGSLTITNTRTKHSGLYKLEINHRTGTLNLDFSVTVYESPAVIGGSGSEMKSVSETEGNPVTLQTDTETHGKELIVWRFGDEEKLIAKHDLETKSVRIYNETDERFRDRLKLDHQTGSLTIINSRITDSGVYKLKISSSKQTLYKRFIVTVSLSGLSPAAVAGIVVGVLLVFLAVAAAAGVFKYCLKVSELQKPTMVTVGEGESFTLTSGIEINKDDQIQWRFGDKKTLIAEIQRGTVEITVPDGRFRDRLEMDKKTGSLTITDTRTDDTGVYELRITGSRLVQNLCRRLVQNLNKRFIVSVKDEVNSVSVMMGADVTLRVNPEIQTGDKIFWMFGHDNRLVAKNTKEKCEEESECSDDRFKDTVYLNRQTGDLTIKKIRTNHSGKYKLKIIRNGNSSFKLFTVIVSAAGQVNKSVLKGRPVTLNNNIQIQKDDKIQWKFGEKLIAEMTGVNRENPQWTDEFRGQMKLDPQTGSLTIQQTRSEHSVLYKLEINTRDYSTFRLFRLTVFDEVNSVPVMEEADVTLRVNTEIQTGDKIFWMFGHDNRLIDKNTKEKCEEESEFRDYRFKPNVDLNHQTGDLTIKKIRAIHAGEYKLKIIRNGKASLKLFIVIHIGHQENKSVPEGDSVTLYDTNSDIQKDDKIQWKFGEKLIAEMTEKDPENIQRFADEFSDQMKLNPETGSLIIQRTRPEHSGLYKLEIKTRDYSTFRLFSLIVFDEQKSVSVTEGADVTLHAKIQTGDKIFWRFRDDNRFLDKNTEEESEYRDFGNKDTVVLNRQNGDLTIKKISTDHTGKYKLKIIRNDKSSFKLFKVTVSAAGRQVNKSVLKGDSVTLNYDTEIREDGKIQWKFGEKLIVEMTGENRENPQWTDEFRDRMKLDPQTGSLIIEQTRPEHSGLYKLEIKSRDYSAIIPFRLIVCDEEETKPLKDSTEKRENESVTVVMPLLKAEDRDGVNEQDSPL